MHMTEYVRRAAVAGSWYPQEPAALTAAVERYLAEADVEAIPSPRAVVAPHAGLMYSGPVAAYSYKAAAATQYATIVLVGPSHFVPFEGVSLWPRGAWQMPSGPIAVDEALAASIASAARGLVVERADAHGREHSLELQLPFAAHIWPAAAIVPLVMGRQTRDTAFALGDAMAAAIESRSGAPGDVLLVASSDLSHYEDARTAASMDAIVMEHVQALDPDGLMSAL